AGDGVQRDERRGRIADGVGDGAFDQRVILWELLAQRVEIGGGRRHPPLSQSRPEPLGQGGGGGGEAPGHGDGRGQELLGRAVVPLQLRGAGGVKEERRLPF